MPQSEYILLESDEQHTVPHPRAHGSDTPVSRLRIESGAAC